MFSSRTLVITVLFLLAAGIGLSVWNARENTHPGIPSENSQSESEKDSSNAGLVGENVSFLVTEGETKKWKINAKKALYNDTRTSADLSEVEGEFYNTSGEPVLAFKAPKGHYTNENNAVELTGGVVAKSIAPESQDSKGSLQAKDTGMQNGELKAPKMVWSAKTDRVTASGGVELIFPKGVSKAETCKFSLDFSFIAFSGHASSVFQAPSI